MTKSLQTALAPLLIIGSFCGLGLFEYPLGHPKLYLSCLYILTIWSLFTYFIYYPGISVVINMLYNSPFSSIATLYTMAYIIVLITAIISILVSFFYFKELKMCLHELSLVDDTIEAIGAPKKYQRLRKWIIRIIIGWIAYIFYKLAASANFDFVKEYNVDLRNIYEPFVVEYPSNVHILSTLIWGTILGYTSSKFDEVNDRLHVFYFDLFENNADYRRQNRFISVYQRITETEDRKQYIWIITEVKFGVGYFYYGYIFNCQMYNGVLVTLMTLIQLDMLEDH